MSRVRPHNGPIDAPRGDTWREDPGPSERERDRVPLLEPGSFVKRTADALTLVAALLAPLYGFALGGRLGLPFADIAFGLVIVLRGYQFVSEGIPLQGFRRLSFLFAIIGLFAVGGALSAFANGDPVSWAYLRLLIATGGIVFVVATFGAGRRVEPRLLQAYVAGGVILAGSSILGVASVQGRQLGLSIHPNSLGHSCMLASAAALWLADNAPTRRWRVIWLAAAAMTVLGVVQSGSRGGALGLAIGLVIYLLLSRRTRPVVVAIGFTWASCLLLASGLIDLPQGNPLQRLLVEGTQDDYGANAARYEELRRDLDEITQNPVFGNGFERIVEIHTVYFQGWIGGGVLGAIAIIGLGCVMCVMPLWQRRRDLALSCGLAAIAVTWLFTNLLGMRDQWMFIGVAFAASPSPLVLLRRSRERRTGTSPADGVLSPSSPASHARHPADPRHQRQNGGAR